MVSSRNTSSSIMSSSAAAAGGGGCGMPGVGWALFAAAPDGTGGGGPRRLPLRPPELIAGEGSGQGAGVGGGKCGD
uniref:Uncharacterized protein n=1 Tax=Arundo donax TaxID=35708 RepID=A0A0A9EA92_ARUDO